MPTNWDCVRIFLQSNNDDPMHPNQIFRQPSREHNLAFARGRGFGTLVVASDGDTLLSHVPFVLNEAGDRAAMHLVASNPILQILRGDVRATVAVSGPDSYVSPNWYGAAEQVPTWNYVAVHLRGTLHACSQDSLLAHLEELSDRFESGLGEYEPWTLGKLPEEKLQRLLAAIAPIELRIDEVRGTWKLNQNKSAEIREAAAGHIAASNQGHETRALAALMRALETNVP